MTYSISEMPIFFNFYVYLFNTFIELQILTSEAPVLRSDVRNPKPVNWKDALRYHYKF